MTTTARAGSATRRTHAGRSTRGPPRRTGRTRTRRIRAYAGNAADFVEIRVKPLAGATAFRVTLNSLTDPAAGRVHDRDRRHARCAARDSTRGRRANAGGPLPDGARARRRAARRSHGATRRRPGGQGQPRTPPVRRTRGSFGLGPGTRHGSPGGGGGTMGRAGGELPRAGPGGDRDDARWRRWPHRSERDLQRRLSRAGALPGPGLQRAHGRDLVAGPVAGAGADPPRHQPVLRTGGLREAGRADERRDRPSPRTAR